MNVLLPEGDPGCVGRTIVAEQRLQSLRPGEGTGFYIPNPNCVVRGARQERRMFVGFSSAIGRGAVNILLTIEQMLISRFFAARGGSYGCFVSLNVGG